MKNLLTAIVAAVVSCATIAHAQTDSSKKQPEQMTIKKYESSDDTLPGKHGHSSWSNMQLTFEGKEYKFVEDEGKVVLLYVDGEKIPDEKINQYNDVIGRIKKQLEEQRKLFAKERERMRQQQESFRLQQRNLMDKQRAMMRERDSANRLLMAGQTEQFRVRDTLNTQLYRQRQELYHQQQQQYKQQHEQFRKMRDSSGYAFDYPVEPMPPMEPMAPAEPFAMVAPTPAVSPAPIYAVSMAPMAMEAPLPPFEPAAAMPAVAPFADAMVSPMPVVAPDNRAIRDILDYLEDKDVKIDEDNVSFSLNAASLTINGAKQPETLFSPLKKMFIEHSNDHIAYSTKKNGDDRTTQTDISINHDNYSRSHQVNE